MGTGISERNYFHVTRSFSFHQHLIQLHPSFSSTAILPRNLLRFRVFHSETYVLFAISDAAQSCCDVSILAPYQPRQSVVMDATSKSREHAEPGNKPMGKLRRSCEGCREFKVRCHPNEKNGDPCQRYLHRLGKYGESLTIF